MKKNDVIQINIDSLNSEGVGVGRHEGLVVFVSGALPGERVQCKIIKVKKNYAIAHLELLQTESPERAQPPCPYYSKCGGCSLQHMGYQAQLAYKGQRIQESLQRIGGLDYTHAVAVEASPLRLGYRNKAAFPVAAEGSGFLLGPFAKKSHRVIDVQHCIIQHEKSTAVIAAIRGYTERNNIPAYDEKTGQGILRHMVLRVSSAGGAVLTLVCTRLPDCNGLRLVAEECGLDGVVININNKDTNVILGEEYHTVYGNADMDEYICGIKLRVSPASFLQVNHGQCERLYLHALELAQLKPADTVLDAYCGIGGMSLLFARHAAYVYGVECVRQAIDNAISNAKTNCIDNAEFICGYAEDAMPRMAGQGIKPDVLLLDPPRKGCGREVLQSAMDLSIKKVVYISCNPSTLSRDAAILSAGGYRLSNISGFDMFPQTTHVECAALFELV